MKRFFILLLSLLILLPSCNEAAVQDTELLNSAEETQQNEPENAPQADTDYLESLGSRDFAGADYVYLLSRYSPVPLLY